MNNIGVLFFDGRWNILTACLQHKICSMLRGFLNFNSVFKILDIPKNTKGVQIHNEGEKHHKTKEVMGKEKHINIMS